MISPSPPPPPSSSTPLPHHHRQHHHGQHDHGQHHHRQHHHRQHHHGGGDESHLGEPPRDAIVETAQTRKHLKYAGAENADKVFSRRKKSIISSQTNLHPAARVQERAPSSSSGGSSPSSYCIHKIIVNNQISFICFGARSDGRTFCGGMFVGILLKTNLPYQAPHTLHNIQICDA